MPESYQILEQHMLMCKVLLKMDYFYKVQICCNDCVATWKSSKCPC